MLSLALVEDEMRAMREASKPHRMRRITVETCPVEPHHPGQSCGAPIWEGTRMLAGRLELPPITLPECGGWVVVQAAELSDDVYDGWRNAPCPAPDGGEVGSDGTGAGWEDSRFDPPLRAVPLPEPEPLPEPVSVPVSGRLYDANGPFVFLYVNATNPADLRITRLLLPYRMLGGAGCPTSGAVTLRQTVSVRGGTNIVTGGMGGVADVSESSWQPGMTDTHIQSLTGGGVDNRLDDRFGWQGGPAVPVTAAWDPRPRLELVGPGNDPSSLVGSQLYNKLPGPATMRSHPPYAVSASGRVWYVTDTIEFTWTQVSPAPPASSYCVVPLADCSATGGVGGCG